MHPRGLTCALETSAREQNNVTLDRPSYDTPNDYKLQLL